MKPLQPVIIKYITQESFDFMEIAEGKLIFRKKSCGLPKANVELNNINSKNSFNSDFNSELL